LDRFSGDEAKDICAYAWSNEYQHEEGFAWEFPHLKFHYSLYLIMLFESISGLCQRMG